ncbi:unnamed protein product [Arctogadus glacialis]
MRVYVYGNETTGNRRRTEKLRRFHGKISMVDLSLPSPPLHLACRPCVSHVSHLFIKRHRPSSQAWAKLLDSFSRRDNSPSTEVTSRVSFSFGFPRSVSSSDPFLQEEASSRTLNLI